MKRAGQPLSLLSLALLAGAVAAGCGGGPRREVAAGLGQTGIAQVSARQPGAGLPVRTGTLRQSLYLSGELVSPRAEILSVPRTSVFQLQIVWLAEDGSTVAAGQPVVEFDNSKFTQELEAKRLAAADAASELARIEAQGKTDAEEKAFAVEQKKSDLAKAQLKAEVPQETLPLREYQDRQLAKVRAEAELTKALADLEAQRRGAAADVEVQRITLAKTQREIAQAEEGIKALTLHAPRAGLIMLAEHSWEGRKVRTGDSLFPGMAVATLPDLTSLEVAATLSDVDDGRVRPGMAAVCTLDAYPGQRFQARVVEISPVARESSHFPVLRYFPVRLSLPRLDPRMRPGMSVRVEILRQEMAGVLLAPRQALDLMASPPLAYLAGGGTTPVRLQGCDAMNCAVAAGLTAGQRLRPRPGSAG